ncbi:Protein kinase domain-containing protein, partial [Psidium guajava]
KERLGEGGYGTVYKGRLPDGRPIAVKMLDKSSNNSQDFINEVATIGTIHHVSIIRLLGFCLEGSKRALIYEYMPNGSLGDLLHKEGPNHSLATERLLEIAKGIALGIEYLHKGCNSRILHLDIKPHNILLDQNFNPKISDFGLAKMYSRDRNSIAMTGARGTIGFIAPEIFMRNLGNPSHKSDVYSFGMLLLEMVGMRKHEEAKGNASSESYFPSRIYNEINKDRPLEFGDLVEEEVAVSRKMVMVGLWCIQINPKDRPSMTQVLEMLMGSSESIPMPPKPQFFSPPRAQVVPGSSSTDVDASGVTLTLDSQEM